MKMRNTFQAVVAVAVATALSGTTLLAQQAQAGQSGQISGTAKDEAKKPYSDFSVRARDAQSLQIAGTSTLDSEGAFTLPNLTPAKYSIELVNKEGKVVCTEGPVDTTSQYNQGGLVIDCNKVPVVWWILGTAAGVGITAGALAGDPESPAQ
jgi:hypothetical protein